MCGRWRRKNARLTLQSVVTTQETVGGEPETAAEASQGAEERKVLRNILNSSQRLRERGRAR